MNWHDLEFGMTYELGRRINWDDLELGTTCKLGWHIYVGMRDCKMFIPLLIIWRYISAMNWTWSTISSLICKQNCSGIIDSWIRCAKVHWHDLSWTWSYCQCQMSTCSTSVGIGDVGGGFIIVLAGSTWVLPRQAIMPARFCWHFCPSCFVDLVFLSFGSGKSRMTWARKRQP